MNKLILTAMITLMSVSAFADTGTSQGGSQYGVTNSQANGQANAANQGNAQSITFAGPAADTSMTVKNVPSVGGPALTTSNDTCMGSTSVGAAGVGFGISIGSTWTDNNCTMLKNSRELWNYGMKAASLARMCMDDKNKQALEVTGFKCPTKQQMDAVNSN